MKTTSNPLTNFSRRILFSYRSVVSQEPAYWLLYQPYIWFGQSKLKQAGVSPNERIVCPSTELVIDGFPGSANSFVALTFKRYQTKPVQLAHHLHSPAQILQAIEQKIPTLVTVREPIGAILSIASRRPYITATQGLRRYVGFYNKIKPYADCYLVSSFEQSTKHLDQVIERVNARFHTNFDVVDIEKANAERKVQRTKRSPEQLAAREALREEKRREFSLEKNAQLLSEATALYQSFEKLAHREG
jgi:hypothetical protein